MTSNNYNDLDAKAYETVQNVFNAASEHGLEVEVMTLMLSIMRDNHDISLEEAASEAMMGWDI